MCGSFGSAPVCLHELMLGSMTHTMPADGGPHGGTAIYVRDTVASSDVTLNTALQLITIRLYFCQQNALCLVYLQASQNVIATNFYGLFSDLLRFFLVCEDLNARHLLWRDADPRGPMWSNPQIGR